MATRPSGAVVSVDLLYAAAFVRALATGMAGVLLGIYLAKIGLDAARIGTIVASGLAGAALAALIVTVCGDRLGRRRVLVMLALLAAVGGAVVAVASEPLVIAVAAFAGMINGMGRDRSASLIIDQAIMPGLVSAGARTKAFAWYNVWQDAGHALGALLAGVPALLVVVLGVEEITGIRWSVGIYAGLQLATAILYLRLPAAVETPAPKDAQPKISAETRRTLWRISSLFAIDSLAGGFLTTALVAFFFYERFGVSEAAIGLLFFGARVLNAVSHLGAAWLAARIGLVNTMVFTHIPSSLLLMTVPFAPSFPVAAVLFLVREGLVEMDVPTRQSYVMAVVRADDRMFASGVTHLVRLLGWAAAPAFAGLLMRGLSVGAPLFVGGAMKIAYDVLLYFAFRKQRPPEER
jgi:predicted MFS family arabinose efflux permease